MYVFLEDGTVRVPSETSVPEGIAIVLLRTSLHIAISEVFCQTCTSEDLSSAPHQRKDFDCPIFAFILI